jgi:hypothetical protein
MQVAFQKQRDYVYTLQLDLPCSNSEIIEALQKETWIPDEAGYGQNSFPTRYRVPDAQQPIPKKIQLYIEKGPFKRDIIDLLWTTGFPSLWGVDADRMDAMTYMYGIFTKDCPGYFIRPHTDDRMHVVQGMIYFIDGDDPDQSTSVFSTKDGGDPYRIPTGNGVGYLAANTNNSWHSGQNTSDQDRYSMVFGIRLDL